MRISTADDQHSLQFQAADASSCVLPPRSSLLASLAILIATFAFPALAEDYPKLKAGLWEMERSSDRAQGQPSRTMMCLDDSVQREMFEMGAGAMKGMCSKHDFSFSGNRGTGDFICDIGGSRMHSKSVMLLTGNTAYRTEIDTTYDPPFMGQTQTKTVMTARNTGACKPGQRPGDMIMPNGQTFNMRDVMSGAKGERPKRGP